MTDNVVEPKVELDWVTRLADEVVAEAQHRGLGRPDRLRVGHQPVGADPPRQLPRADHPAPRRRRDQAARHRLRAHPQLGRLRPLPSCAQEPCGSGRVVGAVHRYAAHRRAAARRVPARELGRPLQGAAARGHGGHRHRGAPDQPDRAVPRRRLPRAGAAGDARAFRHRQGARPVPHARGRRGRAPEGDRQGQGRAAGRRRQGGQAHRGAGRGGDRGRARLRGGVARTTAARARRATTPTSRSAPSCGTDFTTVTAYDDDSHDADLRLHEVRPHRDRRPRHLHQRQARVEGRLADALGLRARRCSSRPGSTTRAPAAASSSARTSRRSSAGSARSARCTPSSASPAWPR